MSTFEVKETKEWSVVIPAHNDDDIVFSGVHGCEELTLKLRHRYKDSENGKFNEGEVETSNVTVNAGTLLQVMHTLQSRGLVKPIPPKTR